MYVFKTVEYIHLQVSQVFLYFFFSSVGRRWGRGHDQRLVLEHPLLLLLGLYLYLLHLDLLEL